MLGILLRTRPPLLLYSFRFRDPVTRKWVRARYVATPEEIAARYAEAEITGPAEIRQPPSGEDAGFNPMG